MFLYLHTVWTVRTFLLLFFNINDKKKGKTKMFFFLNVIQFVCVIVWICRERWEICTCRVCVCVRWPLGCFYHFRSTKSHLCKQKKNVVLILLMIWRWCYGTYITSFSSPYVCVLFPPLIIYLRHQPNPKKHHNIVLCNSLVILSLSPFVHWFSIRPPIKSPPLPLLDDLNLLNKALSTHHRTFNIHVQLT